MNYLSVNIEPGDNI